MNIEDINVLIVDDEPAILRSLGRKFTDAGLNNEQVVSANEAMAHMKRYRVDAIVCDNQMTGITGTRLFEIMRHEFPDVARFMMTGDITKTQKWLVENEIGVAGLFSKPCPAEEIISAVVGHFVPAGTAE